MLKKRIKGTFKKGTYWFNRAGVVMYSVESKYYPQFCSCSF
jgi:hypothetical protein